MSFNLGVVREEGSDRADESDGDDHNDDDDSLHPYSYTNTARIQHLPFPSIKHAIVLSIALIVTSIVSGLYGVRLTATRVTAPWPPSRAEFDGMKLRMAILEKTIHQLPRDSLGRQDFALRYNGAKVLPALTTPSRAGEHITMANDPIVALDDDLRTGRCWKPDGIDAQLGIRLSETIWVSDITVDHIAKELVPSTRNAPRHMTIWGVPEPSLGSADLQRAWEAVSGELGECHNVGTRRDPSISHGFQYLPLACVEYNIHSSSNIQTFPTFPSIAALVIGFRTIVVEIIDNWGASSTCLYRLRVHGNMTSSVT